MVAVKWETVGVTTPATKGDNVKAAQQLLAGGNVFKANYHPGEIDGEAGQIFGNATRRAKKALGYPDKSITSNFGPTLHAYLVGSKKLSLAYRTRRALRAKRAQLSPEAKARKATVALAARYIGLAAAIHYAMTRPIDLRPSAARTPITLDCSGSVTRLFKFGGLPDPNGNGWNGAGYTGTIMARCAKIARSQVKPGDLVVYGAYPGEHVAMVMSGDPKVAGNLMLFSHGQEAGPLHIPENDEAAGHAGQAIGYYSAWERV